MRNKPRVFVTLHPRGKNSLGENRQILQHSAYHWGILISPGHPPREHSNGPPVHHHFDVTNSIDLDPVTGTNRNPDNAWRFRERTDHDPVLAFQILGRVMVGKVPGGVSLSAIRGRLEEIPLPGLGVQGENCVSWTRKAITALRGLGLVEEFDLERFMDDALGFADECLRGEGGLGGVMNYTNRVM